MDLVARHKGIYARLRGLWSQTAFFTRDGDMRESVPDVAPQKRGAHPGYVNAYEGRPSDLR